MSEVATYLKVGTTALVLDMIEDGYLSRDLRLESPIAALRAISADPLLRERVPLRNGRSYTALELQLIYLEASEDHVRRLGGDPGAAAVLSRWRSVLAQLAADPMGARREVDWVIKRALIDRYLARQRSSLEDPRAALLDLQYHDVQSDRGLYHLLAHHGEVEQLVSDDAVERARHSPPQTTRARLRGDFIRRATLQGREYQVDWAFVRTISGEDSRTVLCQDPFVAHDERVEQLVA